MCSSDLPFLIKKLLKSVICGTVNSAQMHCSQLTKSTIATEKKKKKKEKNAVIKHRRGNCNPNSHIVYCSSIFVHLFSFHFFFSFWGFLLYITQICFGFKNFFFFFKAKSWISAGIYWNTRNRPKWPKIFSK